MVRWLFALDDDAFDPVAGVEWWMHEAVD